MRPIDAVSLSEGIELHRQSTDQEYEMDRQWAVGYNAGLDRALYSIAYAKTIAPPPNDPLTLEELRGMDGEPVFCVDGQGNKCWCLVNCDDWLPCCYDNETGLWDGCFYGMTGDGKHGLHKSGWLAFISKPENQKDLGGET